MLSFTNKSEAKLAEQDDGEERQPLLAQFVNGNNKFDYRGLPIKWDGVLVFLHVFINTTAIHDLAESRAEVRC